MLARFTSKNQKDWDEHLPYILLAYRSSIHESTGFTPNELMIGWNVKLPIDLIFGQPPECIPTISMYVQKQREHMINVHNKTRKNMEIASNKQKKHYDHRSQKMGFDPGDKVWYYYPRRKIGLSPKLQDPWSGPHLILERISDILYRIKTPRGKLVIHVDKLKKCTNDESRKGNETQRIFNSLSAATPPKTKSGRTIKTPTWYGIPSSTF